MFVGVAKVLVGCEGEVEVADFAKCSLSHNVSIDKAGCGHGRKNSTLCPFGFVGWPKKKRLA
jgi:hypothetical protein